VNHKVGVGIISYDRARRVYAVGHDVDCARSVECDNGGLWHAASEQPRKREEHANANEYIWEYFCFHKMFSVSGLGLMCAVYTETARIS
jgi:hypothetical protein